MKLNIQKDFEDILRIFNTNSVEYIIVGGYAVSFYSQPKYTKDLDIWIKSTFENSQRVLNALNEFGFEQSELTKEDFMKENNFIQIGYPPVRIDFLTTLLDVDFDEAYKRTVRGNYGNVTKVPYLSLDDLLKNKIATGRDSDLYDIKWLKKFDKKK